MFMMFIVPGISYVREITSWKVFQLRKKKQLLFISRLLTILFNPATSLGEKENQTSQVEQTLKMFRLQLLAKYWA